jgi:AcrR family transcriptional regulator
MDADRQRRMRAAPLPPAERRAAIVTATLPLLRSLGPTVTTKEIARAAGVAEGTIFSVFADKEALLEATVCAGFDPDPAAAALRALPNDLPLHDRVTAAVEVLRAHLDGVWQLMTTLGLGRAYAHAGRHGFEIHTKALERLLEADADVLRLPLPAAARLLLGMIMAGSHPMIAGSRRVSGAELATLFLDGMRLNRARGRMPA